MSIKIPYKDTYLQLSLPQSFTCEVLHQTGYDNPFENDEMLAVEEALKHPIESQPLSELAKGKKKITIICSDHTRPVPSKFIIPPMLRAIRSVNAEADITLLIATGMHRPTTREELIAKFGEEIVAIEKIVVHKCMEEENLVELGILPSGARLIINRYAAEADLLLSEGFIEPHFFAGYSGGRKSVLPGVCGYRTVLGNHCSKFIASSNARTGVLTDNPVHRDMLAAAEMAKLKFIVNVVLDDQKKIVKAVAGDPKYAHNEGVAFLEGRCRVKPNEKGDIVITSNGGAPLDQNLYQAVKGMTAAEAAAKENAVIIMCASCTDGTGGEDFYKALSECQTPEQLYNDILSRSQDETELDQWEVQILARILMKYKVILVCEPEFCETAKEMKLEAVSTLEEAVQIAEKYKNGKGHVVVIPDGVSVTVEA